MRTIAALLAATILTASAIAAEPVFDAARVSQDVKTLSSDAFEGRGPATRAEVKTIDFITTQMKAAGLKPGGPGGKWTQDVPLLMSDIVGAPKISLTMGGTTRPLTQGQEIAARAALNGQTSVDLRSAPLVFVG
jgi:hypothetical protein